MAVVPMAQDNGDPALESSLSHALKLRASYLRGQADTLTLAVVRRLLERDLGLKDLHLDAYKSLIKNLVDKVLNEVEDESVLMEKPRKRRKQNSRVIEDTQDEDLESKIDNENSEKKGETPDDSDLTHEKPTATDAAVKSENHDDLQEAAGETLEKSDNQGYSEEKAGKTEDASEKQWDTQEGEVGNKLSKPEEDATEIPGTEIEETTVDVTPSDVPEQKVSEPGPPQSNLGSVDENAIKLALTRRASELKSQAESLTVLSVRRLLEEDLGLEPNGLDLHKQFIRRLVDELLQGGNDDHDIDSPEVMRAEKEHAPGIGEKRLKKKLKDKSFMGKKIVHSEEHGGSDGELSDCESEDKRQGKQRKKKTAEVKKKIVEAKKSADVKRPFSSNVERLREIIKSIGLGVPPAVYRKAKQASEAERDEVLTKELENILSREGLSPQPSALEIRKVKARLAKKKDLDGIESSNIVAEPRRSRAAANSWFTPRQTKYTQPIELGDNNLEALDSDDDMRPKVTEAMDD